MTRRPRLRHRRFGPYQSHSSLPASRDFQMSKDTPTDPIIDPAPTVTNPGDTGHGLSRQTFKKTQNNTTSFQSVSPCYVPNLEGGVTPSYVPPSKSELAALSVAELERRYPGEATVHRGIVDRCNKGYATLDPRFKTLRDFLFHVLTTIGPRPEKAWSLDRIDPHDKRYAPELVRWADPITQQNNKTTTSMLDDPTTGESTPLAILARKYKQQPNSVRKRLSRGWTVEEALVGRRGKTPSGTAAPASDTRSRAVPKGNPWPQGIPAEKFAPAYTAFLRAIPPHWRPYASRSIFVAVMARQRIASLRSRLLKEWPEFEGCDYEYAISTPLGKMLAVYQQRLTVAEAIIPDTHAAQGFYKLARKTADWADRASDVLYAHIPEVACRTARTYRQKANRQEDYEAEHPHDPENFPELEPPIDLDTDDQEDTEDQGEKPGGIDPLHAEMFEPESERFALQEAENQPIMPWRSRKPRRYPEG
jgi:hypothetical protein